jgi:tRNA(fMet)-specific endonuclease VapC
VKYLFDSNVVIRVALGHGQALRERVADCDEGDIVVSAVVYAEVALGSVNGKPPALDELSAFLSEVPVLPFDAAAAEVYARLPFRRGSFDRLIAAHALALDLVLVTDNVADYADVPGLKVENWVR